MLALSRAAVAATSRAGMSSSIRHNGTQKVTRGLRIGAERIFKVSSLFVALQRAFSEHLFVMRVQSVHHECLGCAVQQL